MNSRRDPAGALRCFLTLPHPCGYLPEREAVTLLMDPQLVVDRHLYSQLAMRGFRRSGDSVYRPHCPDCSACISLRVNSGAFRPNRSQRRVWRRNQDLECTLAAPSCDEEHFQLYARYLAARHAGAGMDDPTPDSYRQFLLAQRLETVFLDCRLAGRLVCVAVLDVLDDGLSAVYTFFDPALVQRGLGVYAILQEISEVCRRGLDWLYLGYWIEACQRMNYKDRFRPFQIYRAGGWCDPGQSEEG
ncbi:MAG: arginyltransferase [Gammaproteobacteria bacterium]